MGRIAEMKKRKTKRRRRIHRKKRTSLKKKTRHRRSSRHRRSRKRRRHTRRRRGGTIGKPVKKDDIKTILRGGYMKKLGGSKYQMSTGVPGAAQTGGGNVTMVQTGQTKMQ